VDMRSLYRTIHRDDLRDALALAAALAIVGVSFGALSTAAGVPLPMTLALSLLVFAGGAQFLVIAVAAAGGSPLAGLVGGLLLNARLLPYGLAMGGVIGDRLPARLLGAHILIDESVAFARARDGERRRTAFWLSGGLAYLFWNAGAALGAVAGGVVPDLDALGVDAAFPAALLALLLPSLRGADARRVGLGAAAIALMATPWLPAGLPVLVGLAGLALAGRPQRARAMRPGDPT
jgi:4-azaleucine resistance transporter AzlC